MRNVEGVNQELELFSVIILLYNNAQYVQECLDSVFNQKYPNIEIIIVDDGSKMFNQDGIQKYIEDNKKQNITNIIVYQNEKNVGTVKSANGAIKKSTGNYIKLIAADDALYNKDSLLQAAKALNISPCGIVTGDVMNCDQNLNPLGKYNKGLPEKINDLSPEEVFRRLCIHNNLVAGGFFFKRIFFEEYGLYDESYKLMEDWPTWLYITKRGCKIFYSPFYAIKYRSNGGIGTSMNPIYMADKKRVLDTVIIPAKSEIGPVYYIAARLSYFFINSDLVRKLYGKLFRNN